MIQTEKMETRKWINQNTDIEKIQKREVKRRGESGEDSVLFGTAQL